MTSPWVTEQGWEPVICAPLVLLLWWTTINLSEFCCLTLAEVITCLALLLTTIIVMSPHYNTAMQLRLSSGRRGYPETCFLGTTPCLGCHSNSMVDLGGVWGLLLVEVECCIKNDGCSVNDQFSSLIVALLFSFLLSPFLNIPPPRPSLFLCLSLPVPLLCPWRELIQIVSWSLLLLLLLLSNLPLLPLILCHHLRFTPPFSLLTGSRRQPCLVLDEWELCVNHSCVQKRMWRVVCMCERKTSFHLRSRFSECVCVCVYLLNILCV